MAFTKTYRKGILDSLLIFRSLADSSFESVYSKCIFSLREHGQINSIDIGFINTSKLLNKIPILPYLMSSDHETDSSVENIKSWEVESLSSVEEFDDYSKALDLFNIKSDQDEEPI